MEKFEKQSLPQNNRLPLKVTSSEFVTRSGESDVWKTAVTDVAQQDHLIALKQARREAFVSDEEMRKSKEFYEYLKTFPGFGAFVPETHYFKARLTAGDAPQAFALQQFLQGKTIDEIPDEELYKDPEVVKQLIEFAKASVAILQSTREEKTLKPDFGTAFSADQNAQRQGNMFGNSRYSTNIFITEQPDQNGQRVFFIDTGANADERVSGTRQITERHVMGRMREFNFNRWIKKLESIQESRGKKSMDRLELERQFESPEVLRVGAEEISIHDVVPAHPKTEVPVVFGPGFNANPRIYKENILVLAEEGRRVLSADAPHGVTTDIEHDTAPAELRKAAAILEMLAYKGIEKTDAIGHSEAGIYLTAAALIAPGKFRNLVLSNPAGMIGKGGIGALLLRFLKDERKNTKYTAEHPNPDAGKVEFDLGNLLKIINSNPAQSIRELDAIAAADIRDALTTLKEQGVGISIIHSADDEIFPMSQMQKMANVSMLDGFYSVGGTHQVINKRPTQYTQLAEAALTALEEKQRKG